MGEVWYDGPDYVARARSLGPSLAAAADETERNRELPASIVSALIDNGLFRLFQPRSLGGAELDPMTYTQVVEQIASHDASTGWCVEQANGCPMAAAFLDPEVAQEIFGPPDGIVAWGPVGRAELLAVPGGFRLTGAWNFASGSHHASWLGAHVVTLGADGAPLCPTDGRRNPVHLAVSKEPRDDDRYLVCRRPARHRQRPLFGDGSFHLLCCATPRSHRASRAGSTASAAAICMPAAVLRWRSASRAA
jgi:hypothetical protein